MKIDRCSRQNFCANKAKHGVRNIGELMTKLYDAAYKNELNDHDIIQVSSKMKDGRVVHAIANFECGIFTDISFPYEFAHYRNEFCRNIIKKYNQIITKGKYNKKSP